jgi:hypothetical protein
LITDTCVVQYEPSQAKLSPRLDSKPQESGHFETSTLVPDSPGQASIKLQQSLGEGRSNAPVSTVTHNYVKTSADNVAADEDGKTML